MLLYVDGNRAAHHNLSYVYHTYTCFYKIFIKLHSVVVPVGYSDYFSSAKV